MRLFSESPCFASGGGSSNSLTFTITAGAVDPQSIVVDPAGKFAYVASLGCSGGVGGYVSMYTINPITGALASIGPPVPSGDEGADFVTVDPFGKFAYVATPGDVWDYGADADGSVSTYTINPTTGALTSTGAISHIKGDPVGCVPNILVRIADAQRLFDGHVPELTVVLNWPSLLKK